MPSRPGLSTAISCPATPPSDAPGRPPCTPIELQPRGPGDGGSGTFTRHGTGSAGEQTDQCSHSAEDHCRGCPASRYHVQHAHALVRAQLRSQPGQLL